MPSINADVPALLRSLGLSHVRAKGDEVWAECPAHHDSGDSWSVNTRTGLSMCFACGYRANLQTVVMEVLDCGAWAADSYISKFGVSLQEMIDQLPNFEHYEPEVPEPQVRREFVPSIAIERFGPVPDAELERRHITRIAAGAWGLRWNERTDAWVLPIHNPAGQILGWQEKSGKVVRNRPPQVPKSRTVFGAQHLVASDRIVIVESPLDAVYLETLGITAVASFGAVVSDHQMRLVADYAREICLALDNDEAGEENTHSVLYDWAPRYRLTAVSYWDGAPKDLGEMTPEQVARAFDTTIPALDWLGTHVRRHAEAVSRGSRRSDGKAKAPRGGLRDGARKNRDHDRRGRTANRRG